MPGRRNIYESAMRQGHSAAWDQKWEQAILAYRKALEEFPEEPMALTSLGLALLQTKRLDEALGMYQRAAALAPNDPLALEKTADILERLGRLDEAAQQYMAVAEIHLTRRDVNKAIDNWARASRLAPGILQAHQRLALAYERTGKTPQAVIEYLAIARILQRSGDVDGAYRAAQRALQLDPRNPQPSAALEMIRQGKALPEPGRPRGVTGPLRMAQVQAFMGPDQAGTEEPSRRPSDEDERSSPTFAAQQAALTALADLLFEEDNTSDAGGAGRGLLRGTGSLRGSRGSRSQVIAYLGQGIDSQTRGDLHDAAAAFEKAMSAGLESPAAEFNLGALYHALGRIQDATRHYKQSLGHPDYAVGALFALGECYLALDRPAEAVEHLLGALRQIDLETVPAARAEELSQLYEGVTENLTKTDEAAEMRSLAENLVRFLSGPGWRERLNQARRQLDAAAENGALTPLAELLSVPGTERVVESMRRVEEYMQKNMLPAAMDEALYAVEFAPTYLPVHLKMAEILLEDNRLEAAIAKYSVVAETYRVRGDSVRAGRILSEVSRLAPMDLGVRARLIDLLVAQGKTDEALSQYMDMAEAYYRLANLDMARQTYANALRLAQRSTVDRAWSAQILHQMGDIDMQRLDWRQAVRVYEQLKTLAPGDERARSTLIDLNFRLGNLRQAIAEVDDMLRYRVSEGKFDEGIRFLEEQVRLRPDESALRRRLAQAYVQRGRKADAIAQWDALGEVYLQEGKRAEAIEAIRAIIALGPEDEAGYRTLLAQLESKS